MARGGDNRPKNKQSSGPKGKGYTLLKRVPKSPGWLDSYGKELFKDLCSEMIKAERMQRVDIEPLATYCDLRSNYLKLKQRIADIGDDTYIISNGSRIPIPEVKMLKDTQINIKHYEEKFMLVPLTRIRNKIGTGKSVMKKIDPAIKALGIAK